MLHTIRGAFALVLALLAAPVAAQSLPPVPTGKVPLCQDAWAGVKPCDGSALVGPDGNPISATNPLPTTQGPLAAAASTPLTWSVTTTTTVGPFAPTLGRAIWLTKTTTDTASISVTATTNGTCPGTPLTAANGTYTIGSFSNVSTALSENLGSETRSNAGWCVTITPATNGVTSSGSLAQ